LRERREDIPLLVDHFIEKFNIEMGKEIRGISEGAVRILMSNDWPGNARELRNVIERAIVVAKGNIVTESDISLPSSASDANHRTKSLEEIERAHILVVLNENQWNIVGLPGQPGNSITKSRSDMKKEGGRRVLNNHFIELFRSYETNIFLSV
jgi:DNA-binding NtrC family response regulator